QNSLRTIFKNKNGTVADINLLLIAMLRHEKISADPMLLSTRENGYASEMYPLMNRFNYVIAVAHIDGREIYLDASRPLGFGKLAADCYNGMVRLIAPQPGAVFFDADSLKEDKITSVFIINDDKGEVVGSLRAAPGYVESMDIRSQIREKGESGFFKALEAKYSNDFVIQQHGIDSLGVLEQPIVVHYDFSLKNMTEDIVYFNPMMDEGYRENLFKSADRKYPVEMPYVMNKTFILNMEVPKNYAIEELPKSAKVEFNGGEGFFEYLIGRTGEGAIQLRSRIVLNKAYFPPEDYNSLRDFFGHILKKHNEQIVFKKIK
ncbi:MAG TPA: hypothetical protein VEZ17_00425, partial [Chitinophagaceae bacterium]|nr:hypothetical protein [Chitinophagaceae bacterium]